MWCPRCEAEMAGAVSPDGSRLICDACGTAVAPSVRAAKPSRDARELLAKWAREDGLDGLTRASTAQKTPPSPSVPDPPPPVPAAEEPPAVIRPIRPRKPLSAPPAREPRSRRRSWLPHVIAYAGVALLATGSALVILDQVGGHAGWAFHGWMTALVGQTVLFVGVVSLVNHGLEQTADETADRLDHLRDRLLQIEQMLSADENPDQADRHAA